MANSYNDPSTRKVLFISYLFPPEVGGGGVIRTVKFIKWMRKLSWEPVVLTAKRHDTIMPDSSLLKDIEGVEIYRCRDYFRGIIRYAILQLIKVKNRALGMSSPLSTETKGMRYGPVKRFLYDLICIPDECIGWILPAIRKGRTVIRNKGVPLIFATCPPFSPLLVGYILKKTSQASLVIDYRDRWVGGPLSYGYASWRRKINRWIERIVVNGCDWVITTTENQAKHFKDEYKKENVNVISNGYDNDDFVLGSLERENKNKLVLSHIGRLTHGRSLRYLLMAFESLTEEVLIDIELNFIGALSNEDKLHIEQSKARKHIRYLGPQPHQDALKMMLSSDVLVIIQFLEEDGFNAVPGKIFEYIRASRPILAICPRNSEIWNMMNRYKLGMNADTADINEIKEAISVIHKKWRERTLNYVPSLSVLEKFDRKNQAEQLAEIFEYVRCDR